ncbi:transcription initiation factor TFIID subunit 4b-like isoform X5 [Magnolia sinica]|uniref:transcription initiation factor TFIID subunit 4b-like isoform X5 n=1 Tax=Magnolia sinica TaxID=86752 RepID=UPI002659649E|nr:transcription initiation factor TFIID subunit 4b-like isoform X5 [Magnolia sinica]
MDPSIMKLLEDDEDESTYSGADVDAFTAALNRDIGGDTSNSQLADSDSGMLAHGSNPTANQLIGPQQTSNQEENLTHQHHPKEEHHHLPPQGQHTSETEQIPHGSTAENQHQQNVHSTENDQLPLQQKQSQDDQQHRQTEQNNNVQISEQIPVQRLEQDKFQQSEIQHQLSKLPQLNKPAQAADRANNPMVQNRSPINISIGMLIPVLCSHLDKDRAMQLQTIFTKLRQNEVGKEDFLRVVRNIVGDQMLRQAADQVQMQTRSQIPSATTPAGSGSNARTPPKKSSVGQKKPLEALGTPSPLSSKKQKASSGALLDQSIEQLNDVTAVSGVNLKEEEEQLLSAPKEESRASEASRRVVQEEEERLILQKGPLQKKIAEIMSKCGVKSIGNDVERCLSLCVEERMRGLIGNLIRISKQRVDVEKPRHRIFITSDVRRQILMMNRKAKEDWDKKQAEEAEKLRKNNETEGNLGAEVDKDKDKDKDEGRLKAPKPNKEEDDKMRTTAANVAARAAVGGDDMLSKWQLMAEQARLKREGIQDGASSGSPGKDPSRRPLSASGKTSRDNQEVENKGPSAGSVSGAIRKFGRNQVIMPQTKVARSISIKDVVAVLEREPQMSRSTLIYRLYERMHGNAVPE